MVNHADRVADIFETMRRFRIEPKRIRPVQSRPNLAPYIVLIEGIKDGKPYMNWEPTLIICDETGSENPETKTIYHREDK